MKNSLSKPECKLVIAGPGAGKTHNMVEKVLACMETLHPTRFCAVITYTNAATEEIKSRLAKKGKIPANVFIGTIHSFLNKFVVIPYISLLDRNIEIDKVFLQISSDDIVKLKMKISGQDAAIVRKRLYESLNKRGLITFDQTINLALEAMKNKVVQKIVCKRLQFLFVDEFQDISNKHFEIIEIIRKQAQTEIYCVGDPEQYISGFQYAMNYENIPILKTVLNKHYSVENPNTNNHRCSLPIVKFLNNFNGRIYNDMIFQQQKIENENKANHSIYFINQQGAMPILDSFNVLINSKNYVKNDVFIIAKKTKTVEIFEKIIPYKLVSENKSITQVETMLNIITTVAKKSQIKMQEEANISKLEFRKFVLKYLKNHKANVNLTISDLKKYIEKHLKISISEQETDKNHSILGDLKKITTTQDIEIAECYTLCNIHTAKGLESKVVLCIAKTAKELEYWLETDNKIRAQTIYKPDKKRDDEHDDYSRLGYVAFSRARELLCIACLEKIDETTIAKLQQLGIKICTDDKNRGEQGSLF